MRAYVINRPLDGTLFEVEGTENVFGDLVVGAWLSRGNAIVPAHYWDVTYWGALHKAQDQIRREIFILQQEEARLQRIVFGPATKLPEEPEK